MNKFVRITRKVISAFCFFGGLATLYMGEISGAWFVAIAVIIPDWMEVDL